MPQMDKEMYLEDIFWIMILFFFIANIQEPFSADEIRFFLSNTFFALGTVYLKEQSKVVKNIFESYYN